MNTKFALCYDIIVLILVAIGNYIVAPNALLPCKPQRGDIVCIMLRLNYVVFTSSYTSSAIIPVHRADQLEA